MDITQSIIELLKNKQSLPFLFIGSGLSRRYINLETWEELLQRFCPNQPFNYYISEANENIPKAARLLADDFNKYWWSAEKYKDSVQRFSSKIRSSDSALKTEICEYLKLELRKNLTNEKDLKIQGELKIIQKICIDGIITTNWDLFLEEIFPEYRVYIGQKDLLFSNPQGLAEIYKIHGCVSKPNSLVLTDDDYRDFNEKNPYLAAKLITLFIERPIIFLGYSLNDENIRNIIKSIVKCMGQDNIEKLRENLIFVERDKGQNYLMPSSIIFDDFNLQVPITLIKTDNFIDIYNALTTFKRKIPVEILRLCKEQLYEIAKNNEPQEKIAVLNIDEIDDFNNIEFVVGLGVAKAKQNENEISEYGFKQITIPDIIKDFLLQEQKFNPQDLLNSVIPEQSKKTPYIPVYKYLAECNIKNREQYAESQLNLDTIIDLTRDKFHTKSYQKSFNKNYNLDDFEKVINSNSIRKKLCIYIPFLSDEFIDLDYLHDFLVDNLDMLDASDSTYYRKLVALYDLLKWGW